MTNENRHDNLRERTKAYASRIIRLYIRIQKECHFHDAAFVIARQLLRSGTSVAANHREARHTRSQADKIAKFQIMLQELEESALWLELLIDHQMTDHALLDDLLSETNQLVGIFIASTKTIAAQMKKSEK